MNLTLHLGSQIIILPNPKSLTQQTRPNTPMTHKSSAFNSGATTPMGSTTPKQFETLRVQEDLLERSSDLQPIKSQTMKPQGSSMKVTKEKHKSSAIDADDLFRSMGTPMPIPARQKEISALDLELQFL